MKNKIVIGAVVTFIFLVNINGAHAQEKNFDRIVEMGLPNGLEKLDKSKQQDFIKTRRKSAIDLKLNKGNIYRMDNVLIQINASDKKVANNASGVNTTLLEDTEKSIR